MDKTSCRGDRRYDGQEVGMMWKVLALQVGKVRGMSDFVPRDLGVREDAGDGTHGILTGDVRSGDAMTLRDRPHKGMTDRPLRSKPLCGGTSWRREALAACRALAQDWRR
jgi:hypothetical protein